ncbi:site-specific integrase [Burkholderia stagnalis]|uniref:site-specific integrase n=1 Tax=Burkholderia stagnalis TaxID=1503054 RepID=UPI00163ABF5D|nr:site-specific integrase [Burkholderia stagnalis]
MHNEPVRLYTPPRPTLLDPYAQIKWIFFQLEAEYETTRASAIAYAKNKYLQFVLDTDAYYVELKTDRRFFLSAYWEADALTRFNKWLNAQDLTSKTRYSIYKSVRQVMDMAYALRVTDTVVYHAPMFKGVSETKERSAYNEEEQEVINAALARWIGLANSVLIGYTPTALGIPYRINSRDLPPLELDGQLYTAREAAQHFGVPYPVLSTRLRAGWSHRQAVGLSARPSTSSRPVAVSIEGVAYKSISAAAKAYGVSCDLVKSRLRRGFTPEQSVGIEPRYVLKEDARALLWRFENEYACDALAMCDDFYRQRNNLTKICTMRRLSTLFIRWGVWPYVDDRIIMPLAMELGMLTALNVEALKELEVDSYQKEHQLSGQQVIFYHKRRAGSSSRSEDRELHLQLLEIDELYLEESVVERVEKVIGLILALTSRIRSDAPPDIARRLVIFEDIERSRREGKRAIVALDPHGKAGHWYRRFCSEEGLYRLYGDRFNFSLARCRPTLATNMVLAGATLFEVQVALGHENIQTTATYLDAQGLQPAFNRTVSEALQRIAQRSTEQFKAEQAAAQSKKPVERVKPDGFHETLSGCGCWDPYNPSDNVRSVTKHVEGSVCRYWNMCLRCDSAVVTERSLPKLMVYQRRVNTALVEDSPAIQGRKELYRDTLKLIDGLLEADVVFPESVLQNAELVAATMDDLLVDHLIYQGI